jgi:drug/metabolite transporter (DMT)-like permease
VAQHRASTRPAANRGFIRVALYLVASPLWLLGELALVGAFVFQALALYDGQLSVVQALLVTELVFALVLRQFWIGQHIAPAAWASAGLVCVGLALFVAMSEPQDGHPVPTSKAWLSAVLVFGLGAAALALVARTGSPVRRAACYGTAAAIVWSLEAAFIKAATDSLSAFGVLGTLERWPVYAVVFGGISGTLLMQAALHVGPLSVSQPLVVTVDPFVSIILSVWIFGEHFSDSPTRIVIGVLAFCVMAAGVVLLSMTAPPNIEAATSAAPAGAV